MCLWKDHQVRVREGVGATLGGWLPKLYSLLLVHFCNHEQFQNRWEDLSLGLTHPASVIVESPSFLGLTRPASVTASHETTETSPLSTSSQQQQQQQQQHALPLPVTSSVAPSAAKTLEATMAGTSGGVALQLPPDPIEMPRQQVQIQSSHVSGYCPRHHFVITWNLEGHMTSMCLAMATYRNQRSSFQNP